MEALDLHVEEGEFVSVTGPSGSGKTTFLNIAGLLEAPSSGLYGIDLSREPVSSPLSADAAEFFPEDPDDYLR